MEKRTLIAIALSIAILIGYQYLFVKPLTQPPAGEKIEGVTEKKDVAVPAQMPPVVPVALSDEREVKVETDMYVAVLTSKGGTVKRWDLKNYKDKDGINVSLLKGQGIYPALGIGAQDDFGFSKVNFNVIGKDIRFDKYTKTGSIIFEYATPQYSIRRTYTFYTDKYRVDLRDEVSGLPDYWITVGTDFGIFDSKDSSAHVGPVLLKDTDRIELDTKKLNEVKSYREGLKWIAQEDKYFFAAIVPLNHMEEAKAWKVQDSSVIAFRGKPGINNFLIYAGPKEHDRLKELNVGLEHIIDFGFFSILARPLFWILKFFYKFLGNYGWAIVFLTVIVRIPFIPIVNKGQKTMKKMQELQPRLNEIKEKYKKDPQKMQKEMMEIYKKQKINPMGGCLPILLQIPVFFALYKVLMIAIELRAAPFMLWITDLSAKDPYYILPIVMGITMVIQQKMTPTSMDPTQNKIMMFLPVIFTFMFLNFASGLVLYWLVNNVLSIAQQFYVNRKLARQKA